VKNVVQIKSSKVMQEKLDQLTLLPIPPASDAEILAYLRRSAKLAEIAALAEQDLLILTICKQLEITISDTEWQAAGDAFRLERQLWGTGETLAWLKQQRIRIQDWSQGIRVALLEKKLKEYLFGKIVDAAYVSNHYNYRRLALSQILVFDLKTAKNIVAKLLAGSDSFCALAWEYSQGKSSHENGGFMGIRCLIELLPEIVAVIADAQEGELRGPIQTKLGYHILRIERLLPLELNQLVREQVMEALFTVWLQNLQNNSHNK